MGRRSLRITDAARLDLADIWAFIAADSPTQADCFIDEVFDRLEPLRDLPQSGVSRESLAPGLRVIFCRKYAVYYRHETTAITILRVAHGARDQAGLFDED